jgi:pre-mRNA-processing factor 39
MHQYSRYFERYRQLAQTRPLAELAPEETLAAFRAEVEAALSQSAPGPKAEAEIERDLRIRLDSYHLGIFTNTQTETTKRWTFESGIKRPYFTVTELDQIQLTNWHNYLDFEEAEGSFARIQFLYERALVTAAYYDEIWFRYARWMAAQKDKESDLRIIYQRAAYIHVPIANAAIRLQYAYFEETSGRVDVAKEIHGAILANLPSHVETIISLANLCRRHGGLEAAIEIYKSQLDSPECDMATKAALVAEWARLLWKIKGNPDEARMVFHNNQQYYLDSRPFWGSYLAFEIEQPTSSATESVQYDRIKKVIADIRSESRLQIDDVKELVEIYMAYLLERGTADTAKEYMVLDREVHGPASVARVRNGGFAAPPPIITDFQPVPVPIAQPSQEDAAATQAYAYYQQAPVNGAAV